MVEFCQELSGIVLPYHKFGSHLNSKGEAIDPGKEKLHASGANLS